MTLAPGPPRSFRLLVGKRPSQYRRQSRTLLACRCLLGGVAFLGDRGGAIGVLAAVILRVTLDRSTKPQCKLDLACRRGRRLTDNCAGSRPLHIPLSLKCVKGCSINDDGTAHHIICSGAADRIVTTLQTLSPFLPSSKPIRRRPGLASGMLQYLKRRFERIGFATDLWEPDGPALFAKYEGRPGANGGAL